MFEKHPKEELQRKIKENNEEINRLEEKFAKLVEKQKTIEQMIDSLPETRRKIKDLIQTKVQSKKELEDEKFKILQLTSSICQNDDSISQDFDPYTIDNYLAEYSKSVIHEKKEVQNTYINTKRAQDTLKYAEKTESICKEAKIGGVGSEILFNYNDENFTFLEVKNLVNQRIIDLSSDEALSTSLKEIEKTESQLSEKHNTAGEAKREIGKYLKLERKVHGYNREIDALTAPDIENLVRESSYIENQSTEIKEQRYNLLTQSKQLLTISNNIGKLKPINILKKRELTIIKVLEEKKYSIYQGIDPKPELVILNHRIGTLLLKIQDLRDRISLNSLEIDRTKVLHKDNLEYSFLHLNYNLIKQRWWSELKKGQEQIDIVIRELNNFNLKMETLLKNLLIIRDSKTVGINKTYMKGIIRRFNEIFLKLYSDQIFFEQVFKAYEELVHFDIQTNLLKLKKDNKIVDRLLEAFSTGEKAFAFSIAMMKISILSGKYKILILDEFGALLDYIKQEALWKNLTNTVLGNLADKIIILLPLKDDHSMNPIITTKLEKKGYLQKESPEGNVYA